MELELDQALKRAVKAHREGKLQEATHHYTYILKANHKHADANHNMGILAVGAGKVQEAFLFFKTALEVNPTKTQFWLSYIDVLIRIDRISDAKAVFQHAKIKGAKGERFDELEKRLVTLNEAKSDIQNPSKDQIQPLINLHAQGHHQKSINEAKRLLTEFPRSTTLYNIIGAANHGLGNPEEAIEAYKKALSIKPNYAEAYNNMGLALKDQNNLEEALEAFKTALSIKPNYAEAYNNMGLALKDHGKVGQAIESYRKALSLKPHYAAAFNNMGLAFKDQDKPEEALDSFNEALLIEPNYAEAYSNTTELLKTYTPKNNKSHSLFAIDGKIKKLSEGLINARSNEVITSNLIEGLNYIIKNKFVYKSPLSQIYNRNYVDLNCKRHSKIFTIKNIIPEFCFGCFKVQVEVVTFIDLIKVTSLFYKFCFQENLTKKTMVELRPIVSGYYKGLIFCNGLDQAIAVKHLLDISLKEVFDDTTTSKIKRGCSEYPLQFPQYGKIAKDLMEYPKEWRSTEEQFDQNEIPQPLKQIASLSQFCLSDFYIIQKWIDYAKGIGDQTVRVFNNMPIIFPDIYELAKKRSNNQITCKG